jgi:hypothetical protein
MNKKKKGYVVLLLTLIFSSISIVILMGVVNPLLSAVASTRAIKYSKQSVLTAHSATEEALYRLRTGKQMPSSTSISLLDTTATITVSDILGGKEISVTGLAQDFERKIKLNIALGTGISFHYGIQAGVGGFELQNTSSVTGNIFSAGPVIGNGNLVRGDVISAGPLGRITGINATGTAYAHTIQNSTIGKNAYYTVISNTTVGGTSYPGSPDQEIIPLPISDAQILEWENDAAAGGTIGGASCSGGKYSITSNTTLGPIKIDCNLEVKGNGVTLNVTGPIWVNGNIITQTAPIIRIDPSLGSQNVPIIADKQSDRNNGGTIVIGQNTVFQGSGSQNSFVFIISYNTSAENGGSVEAIDMGQSSGGMVAYASHGMLDISQTASIKEATGYKIRLRNSANVIYDTGLPNVLFSAGPAGGYTYLEWNEI